MNYQKMKYQKLIGLISCFFFGLIFASIARADINVQLISVIKGDNVDISDRLSFPNDTNLEKVKESFDAYELKTNPISINDCYVFVVDQNNELVQLSFQSKLDQYATDEENLSIIILSKNSNYIKLTQILAQKLTSEDSDDTELVQELTPEAEDYNYTELAQKLAQDKKALIGTAIAMATCDDYETTQAPIPLHLKICDVQNRAEWIFNTFRDGKVGEILTTAGYGTQNYHLFLNNSKELLPSWTFGFCEVQDGNTIFVIKFEQKKEQTYHTSELYRDLQKVVTNPQLKEDQIESFVIEGRRNYPRIARSVLIQLDQADQRFTDSINRIRSDYKTTIPARAKFPSCAPLPTFKFTD